MSGSPFLLQVRCTTVKCRATGTAGAKKNAVIPWHEKTWCIPPAADAEFVARMEDLLELYQVPYDARRPVVCMDELCKQLIAETRVPLPVCEGHPARYDYEYERKGVCSLFVFVEPRHGWRKVSRMARM